MKLYESASLMFFELCWGFGVDLSPKIEEEEIKKCSSKIPVLSEYGMALKSHVKL